MLPRTAIVVVAILLSAGCAGTPPAVDDGTAPPHGEPRQAAPPDTLVPAIVAPARGDSTVVAASTAAAVASRSPVDSLLATLDDRALAGQMIMVYRADNAFLLAHGFGGVLLFASMLGDPAAVRADLADLQQAAPVPYLVALDQEGGAVSRLDALPGWRAGTPGATELATWPADSVRAEGQRIGRALRGLGVNLNLAPVLDSTRAWDGQPSGWPGAAARSGHDRRDPARRRATSPAAAPRPGWPAWPSIFPATMWWRTATSNRRTAGRRWRPSRAASGPFGAAADVTAGVMMSSIIHPPLGPEPAVLNPTAVAMARAVVGEGLIMTDDLWGTALRAWRRPDLQILPAEYPDRDWLALGEAAVRAGNDLLLITYPAKAALLQRLLAERVDADPHAACGR